MSAFVAALLVGLLPGGAIEGAAAGQALEIDSLASCPSSASWAMNVDVFNPQDSVPVPATIMMADGTSRPVGVVTPPSPSPTLTGSTNLSWSPDGTALAFWQITSEPGYLHSFTPVIADWDGSNPALLPGLDVFWSPASDRVLVSRLLNGTVLATQIGRRTSSGWAFVAGPNIDAPTSRAAWSSDGTILAWVDPAGDVWVGDADGQDARIVGQAAGEESPLQFKPNTHLVRVAGPTWFDVDADAVAGAAPQGRLSPSGEWSAWSTIITDPNGSTSELYVSHNGGPPVRVATGAWFPSESLSWSPDSRYLVSDDFEVLPTEIRRAPILYDTVNGTAAVVGPWTSIDLSSSLYGGFLPTMFRWAPDSTSFFAQESTWSDAVGTPPVERALRYRVDGTRTLVHDWGLAAGAIFWPRSTPITHLDLSARLDAVDADGSTRLHVTVTNDGPCDAADVVIDIETPAGSPGVSVQRAVQTIDVGLVRRGEVVDRVFDLMPSRDLPLTIAVATSTDDEGRSAGPLTLTMADVAAAPPGPPVTPAAGPVAVAVPARPTFAG